MEKKFEFERSVKVFNYLGSADVVIPVNYVSRTFWKSVEIQSEEVFNRKQLETEQLEV